MPNIIFDKLKVYSVSGIVFLYIYTLVSAYICGDQEHYRNLYDFYGLVDFDSVLEFGVLVGAKEPVSLFLIWVGAFFQLDKDLYISIWGGVLLYGFYLLLKKHNAPFLLFFFIATNFYIIVLLTSAERLKFSYVFIVYAFLFFEKKFFRNFLFFLAILSHFQSIIFVIGLVARSLSLEDLKKTFSKKLFLLFLCAFAVFSLFLYFFAWEVLFHKVQHYAKFSGFKDAIKWLMLLGLVFYVVERKYEYSKMMFALLPFFLLFGDSRLTMIAFTLILLFLIRDGMASHPLFLVLMLYFSAKSIGFVYNIFSFGVGFI